MIPPGATYYRVTRAHGHYDRDGQWQPEREERLEVLARVYQDTPVPTELLAEGARTSTSWVIVAAGGEPILYGTDVAGQRQPDVLDFDGRPLTIQSVHDLGDDGRIYRAVERGADLVAV